MPANPNAEVLCRGYFGPDCLNQYPAWSGAFSPLINVSGDQWEGGHPYNADDPTNAVIAATTGFPVTAGLAQAMEWYWKVKTWRVMATIHGAFTHTFRLQHFDPPETSDEKFFYIADISVNDIIGVGRTTMRAVLCGGSLFNADYENDIFNLDDHTFTTGGVLDISMDMRPAQIKNAPTVYYPRITISGLVQLGPAGITRFSNVDGRYAGNNGSAFYRWASPEAQACGIRCSFAGQPIILFQDPELQPLHLDIDDNTIYSELFSKKDVSGSITIEPEEYF